MPQKHLSIISKSYPNAWREADEFRADRGKDIPDWPAWCFLPLAGWYAIVSAQHRLQRIPIELIRDMQVLGALGAWRPTQGIYKFDPELYDALVSTPLDGDLPSEVLYRLPAWCVYVETPMMSIIGHELEGFFAHLECDANSGSHELRFVFCGTGGKLCPMVLHIGQWGLAEGLRRMCEVSKFFQPESGVSDDLLEESITVTLSQADTLRACINLLLYLCSTEPDARGPAGASYTGYPQAKKIKTGWRLFAPDSPTVWHMGETVGEIIRKGRAAPRGGTHASPRPHIRRAHWHGFWSGTVKPREGIVIKPRKFDIKWIPPIPVAMGDDEEGI